MLWESLQVFQHREKSVFALSKPQWYLSKNSRTKMTTNLKPVLCLRNYLCCFPIKREKFPLSRCICAVTRHSYRCMCVSIICFPHKTKPRIPRVVRAVQRRRPFHFAYSGTRRPASHPLWQPHAAGMFVSDWPIGRLPCEWGVVFKG